MEKTVSCILLTQEVLLLRKALATWAEKGEPFRNFTAQDAEALADMLKDAAVVELHGVSEKDAR